MISKLIIQAEIDREAGSLKIADRKRFVNQLKNFAESEVEVIIQRRPQFRSDKLLRYFMGVVVVKIMEALNERGFQYSRREAKEYLCDSFLYDEFHDEITGEIKIKHLSLSHEAQEVSNRRMLKFIEDCKQFASEHLETYIENPNEHTVEENQQ